MVDYTVALTPLIIKETGINNIIKLLQEGDKQYFGANVSSFEILKFEERPVSQLFKVKVCFDSESRNIFIKIEKPCDSQSKEQFKENLVKGYEIGRMLYERFSHENEYSAVNLIACFPEQYTLVTEECIGDTLSSIIVNYAKWYPTKQKLKFLNKICYNCGLMIRNIHEATQRDGLFDIQELIEYIDIRLRKSVADERTVFNEEMRQKILKYLRNQALLINKNDLRIAGTHGDFGPENIFVENQTVKSMDYADFPNGSIYQDITYFYQRLENFMHKPIFRPRTIHALQNAFCQGYGLEADPQKPIFMMFRVRHVINNFRSIFLGKIIPKGEQLPFYKRIFNEMILKGYLQWLSKTCTK